MMHLSKSGVVVIGILLLAGCGITGNIVDVPVEPNGINVTVNLTEQRFINGISQLERQNYFMLHHNGRMPPERPETSQADIAALFIDELNLYFGKLTEYGWTAGGVWEDPERPGYVDPGYFDTYTYGTFDWFQTEHADRIESVITAGVNMPEFMIGNRGPILPEDFDAYADFKSMYFQAYTPEGLPKYYEVWNEIEVKRWDGNFTWEDIAEIHVVVAERIHQDIPGLKVGGPTAAWPEFTRNDFDVWDGFASFIDNAGPTLDFLSLHFYDWVPDDYHLTGYQDDSFFNSVERNQAKLDLWESYSAATLGEVKPLVVSEYGGYNSTHEEPRPVTYWYMVKSVNNMVMEFLERPDRVVKSIPFILSYTAWNPDYYASMLDDEGDYYNINELSYFYRLWAEVSGNRLVHHVSDRSVRVNAYYDQDTVYIALNNLCLDVAETNIEAILPAGTSVNGAYLSRHYFDWDAEQPQLGLNIPLQEWDRIVLTPHETAILKLVLNQSLQPPIQVNEKWYYSERIVVPMSASVTEQFGVAVDLSEGNVNHALLRLAVALPHSASKQLDVSINGHTLQVPEPVGDQAHHGDYYGVFKMPVPADLITANNVVDVAFPDAGGWVSSITLTVNHLME